MAAVASVIECELSALPDLFDECCVWDDALAVWADGKNHWWDVTQRGLKKLGWYIFTLYPATGVPAGYALAGGDSPRAETVDEDGKNAGHIVVVKDGALTHDPHPSGDGLLGEPTEYYVLVKLATQPIDEEARYDAVQALEAENEERGEDG